MEVLLQFPDEQTLRAFQSVLQHIKDVEGLDLLPGKIGNTLYVGSMPTATVRNLTPTELAELRKLMPPGARIVSTRQLDPFVVLASGITSLARVGYNAYGAEAEWKAYDGRPMPEWDELPEHIRTKWRAATHAILEEAAAANAAMVRTLRGHIRPSDEPRTSPGSGPERTTG